MTATTTTKKRRLRLIDGTRLNKAAAVEYLQDALNNRGGGAWVTREEAADLLDGIISALDAPVMAPGQLSLPFPPAPAPYCPTRPLWPDTE